MKKNSWKTFLSVVLLLTMLVSMLPSAAFAEETQSADAQTAAEETVKVEENKDTAKAETKTENKDAVKEEAKTENKDAVKEETKTENKDAVKEEAKTENKDAVKEEAKTENKDAVKEETKTEDKDTAKEKSEDEPEKETKDEAEGMSDAVKAFLAAVEAIDTENPDPAALEAAQIQHDTTLSEEEQSLPEVAAAFAKLLGLIGYEADTQRSYNSVPLTLRVSGYYWNPNTQEHTVNGYTKTEYIKRTDACDGNGANASGSATARFVGSNESGWTLVIDVVVGNYTATWTTNAKIYNKDMSNATGSITFGMSWNTSGGVSTTIWISGDKPLPVTKLDTTLKYDANCTDYTGTVPASETKPVEKGKNGSFTVKGNGTLARPGYTFVGWTEDAVGNGTLYTAGMTITVAAGTTKTLYAKWEKIPEQVEITLTYDPNGGNGSQVKEIEKVTEGESYTFTIKSPDAIGITAKDGYEFTGWNTQADGKGDAVTGTITISASSTIYAQWKKLPTTATVIYHANGGTATTDPVIRADVDPSAYRVETTGEVDFTAPSGKTFLTWNTEQDGSGTSYDPRAAINIGSGDTLELWAQWFESTTPTPDLPNWNGLEITKVTDPETATVAPGEELTYKITVTNHTGVDLNNVVVVDTLPAGVTFVSASAGEPGNGTVTVTIPALAKDAVHSFTVTVRVNDDTTGSITNTATIVNAVGGVTELGKDISASVTTPVEPKPGPAPDWDATLRITKEIPNMVDGKVTLGDEFTYTITVWNSSDYTMENIVVSDTLPSEVDYVSCSGGLTYDSNTRTLTATIDSLDPGRKIFGIAVKVVDVSSDTITNTAKITHAECNGNVWDGVKEDTVSIGVVQPIEISKAVNKTTAAPGETLTYTITVTNNTSDAVRLNVIDTLPQNITVDEATISNGGRYNSAERAISWSVELSTKGNLELSFEATIDADFAGDVIAANHVQTTFNDVVYDADSDSVEINRPVEMPAKVVVNFVGIDTLPESYTITGDATNPFLKGALTPLTKDAANKTYTYTAPANISALLNTAYDLKFTQSNFAVDGYTCDKTAAVTANATATSKETGMVVTITLTYTKNEPTPVEMDATVTVKFVGLDKDTKLPAYTLTGAPPNEFLSGAIALTKDEAADTAVYTGKIQAVPGKAYDLKFAQTGFNVDGYKCDATAAVSKTVTADAKKGVEVTITLNYTKTDAEKTEMPVAVNVKFVGLDKDTKLPAYTLTGAPTNEFLSGAVALTKDETADTMTYTGKIQAVPGKAYGLSFIQSGFDVTGFICDASAVVTKNVTADAKTGVVVDLVLTYTKINWGGLTITKTADKTYATPGSYVKYTITVTNNTGVDLTNVNVLDYLPSTVRYSSSFGGYNSGTSSWTIARLADGKSATITIRVKLNSGLSTGTKIENTAYVTGVTIDGQEYVFENLWLNDTAIVIVTEGKGAPKTGDESNLGLWIAVMAASLACAGAAIVIYKKRRTGND